MNDINNLENENNKEVASEEEQNTQNNKEQTNEVSIDDFAKLDLRLGKIVEAEEVEGSDKLIKCLVDFGDLGERTIVSGIKAYRSPEDLIGNKYLYITNLKPRKIFGIESQGMLVAAHDENDNFAMLVPDADVETGAKAG